MPNHVTNQITASPEAVRALLRHPTAEEIAASPWSDLTPESWVVDFSLLIPTPDDYIAGDCSHRHGLGYKNDPFKNCWYSWNIRFWGTKWNGYSTLLRGGTEGDRAVLRFDTAWSHPFPVIDALSAKFPDETILVEYADGALGQNQGEYEVRGGAHRYHTVEDGTDAARDHAAHLKYGVSYAELTAWGEEGDEAEAVVEATIIQKGASE